MPGLLTVFSGPYALIARIAMYALLVAAIWGHGWVKGNQHGTEKLTNYQAAQVLATQKVIVKQGAVTERIVTKYVETKAKTQVVTQYVDREVVKYAQSNPGSCIDPEFVRLLNLAAANAIPDPAKRTDGSTGAPSTNR